jgi:hypothetical protein
VDAIAFGACAVRVHPGPPWFEAVRPHGARGLQTLYATLDDMSFQAVPVPPAQCNAVHPDAYRAAACAREPEHAGYHATDDGLTEWQTADVSKTGGISCVTIDRAAGNQTLTFGEPLKPGDSTARRRYAPESPPAGNRKARRAARKIKR